MNNQSKKILGLFARYLSILLIGIGNLYIIYKILTPLTIHVLNAILSIFTNTVLLNNMIKLNEVIIEIVPACVAGSAFYLLFLLVMSTADIKPKIRIRAFMISFAMLFALNTLRILILIPMANAAYFETVHWIFWHLVSTIFVIGVWLGTVKIYKIKKIPVYSDIRYMISLMKLEKKKSKKSKKSKRKKKHK